MAIQKIIIVPSPILRQKAKKVGKIDKKILTIIRDMKDTLTAAKEPKGIGLSAPQIGKSWQICLIAQPKEKEALILLNPRITLRSKEYFPEDKEKKGAFEGCLSVPNLWGIVRRSKRVKVRYLNIEGKSRIKSFSSLGSIAAQHEIDHLNGILFIDRILKQHGKLYRIEKNKQSLLLRNKEGKEELVEVKLD